MLFSSATDLGRLLQTVRHLRPTQIFHRVLHHLPTAPPDTTPAPPLRKHRASWIPPIPRQRSLLGRWKVRFLNEDGDIARADQWNDPAKSKLWLYNLHYFDDLSAPADNSHHQLQRDFLDRWIAENAPGTGNGWEPYPTSLRIANWIKWALAGTELESRWLDSLAQQIRWLSRRIEWHLLGNHLLANAKALVLAGLFFEGPEAEAWLAKGLGLYARELPEQILRDGGHFELSPMYHAIILEDLLDIINAARTYGRADNQVFRDLPAITTRMRQWLAVMTHPDGELSLFNDAAFGVAPNRTALEDYAWRLHLPAVTCPSDGVRHLRSSGYVRVDIDEMAAILDLADVGPDYIPGHAHADTLSFELSLGAERILVNMGTSTYERGPLRELQRATRSHNTLEIADTNSSDVWASFRVGRRARVSDVFIEKTNDCVLISGMHDGYRHLAGRPLHRRTWHFGANSLSLRDEILGSTPHEGLARFILSPSVQVIEAGSLKTVTLRTARGRSVLFRSSTAVCIENTQWYPEFGQSVSTQVITVPVSESALHIQLVWLRHAHSFSYGQFSPGSQRPRIPDLRTLSGVGKTRSQGDRDYLCSEFPSG